MRAASGWTLAIDFGTSYTVAAIRIGQRPAEVIEIAGERRVPSVVLADEAGLVVGRVAEELAQAHPERALRTPKSRMGDIAPVLLAGHPYQIVDLVAALLGHIAAEAKRYVGSSPSQVRLTHPATWNGLRRTQLVRAATAAGLPEVVLVPEPVAAAISYAQEVGVDLGRHVVVYDLGGGTFDTAVLRSTGAGFEVIGRPTGDLQLGGELFDELVANSIGAQLDPLVWEAIQVSDEPRWQRAASSLRRESRRAKEALSAHPYAELLVALPGGVVQHRVTRVQLDELIRPHVEESVSLLLRCMSDASVSADDIEAVFLAGGGSRSPLVEEALRAALPGVGMSRRGDPKLAVALGACEDSATPPMSVALPPATSAEAAPATTIEPAPPGRQAEPTVADGPPVAAAPTVAAGMTTIGLGVAALPPPVYEVPTAPARPARAPGRRRLRPIVASLGGAVLLLGAGAGVLATRSSSTPRTATTTTISAPPTTNPPPPPTTPRPTDPPTTTTTAPASPTQADVDAAVLTASDVGAGWTSDEQGWFLTSICDNKLLGGPRHWAESDFNRKDPAASVVSSLDSYDSASEADLLMRQARDAAGACPTFTHQSSGDTYDFRVSLIADYSPWCDDTVPILVKRDGGGEQLSGVHLLIRCGRNIATFEYFAADLSGAAVHELTALTATAVDHLQAIPR